MKSALSHLAETINLDANETALVRGLLQATPIAMRGEETQAPIDGLLREFPDSDPSIEARDAIEDCLRGLVTRQRSIAAGNSTWSFAVLDSVSWSEDGDFIHFKVNSIFCQGLEQLARRHDVGLF
jgi:hypothetical protein